MSYLCERYTIITSQLCLIYVSDNTIITSQLCLIYVSDNTIITSQLWNIKHEKTHYPEGLCDIITGLYVCITEVPTCNTDIINLLTIVLDMSAPLLSWYFTSSAQLLSLLMEQCEWCECEWC